MANNRDYNVVLEVDPDEGDMEFQGFATNASQTTPSGRMGTGGAKAGGTQSSTSFFGSASTLFPGAGSGPQPGVEGAAGPATSHALWHVEYYAHFFNVDTTDVLERMWQSVLPSRNFLDLVGANPDLYGPFWIATTVIFAMFVTSSLAQSIVAFLHGGQRVYDFTTLSFAVFTVYPYLALMSLGVWGATKYFGCHPSLLEIVSVYGYAFTVWIPIAIACVAPNDLVRWILTLVAFGSSAFFICRNIFHIIARSNATVHRAFILVVLGAHAALALIFKIKFFSYTILPAVEPKE
ncbi:hypothetical protein IWQ60_004075 [Tieghemiomyces parasiticus]|uniref:Protein YIP n=1 Tax=Tieghemiomyces parasiticus TaxID=78921 RepID=A0A9W8DVU7_9FUNG|nr:hypothetical protein IWQ60_004075 [Tieghemiomyces parasiticus]